MHPHFTYLGDNATTKVLTPNIDDSQGFSLAGTSAATAPIVYVGTVGAETVDSSGNQAPVFSFYSVSEFGSAAHPLYGKMDLVPASGRVSIDHGIMLSHGNLQVLSEWHDPIALGGTSVITNGSNLALYIGHYQSDPTTLNGSLSVNNGSTADLRYTHLQGQGTISIGQNSTVDANMVSAGLHVDVGHGGMLFIQSYTGDGAAFQATIHEAPGGMVDLGFAAAATSEVFHRATGVLDLLNAAGTQVASLKFTGNSTLYAAADGHGGMDITTAHSVGSLPAIFVN